MSNFNTSGLLQALDRIKPELKPLPQHFITSQDQHTRELYATLLAAVLLSDGQVSEPQSRLFGMLLQSMQLEPVPARFFELAQQLDAGKLKGAIRGIHPVGQSFALDALILARLSAPLHQQQLHMIAELFDALDMSQYVAGITKAVAFLLALGEKSDTFGFDLSLINKSPILKDLIKITDIDLLLQNGVWTDPKTKLMWSRINIGQQWKDGKPIGVAKSMSWSDANKACREFRFAGFNDWRLPSLEELQSLMFEKRAGYQAPENMIYPPDLDKSNDFGLYWSASSPTGHPNFAQVALFNNGSSNDLAKSANFHVRAVRGIAEKQLPAARAPNLAYVPKVLGS